MALDAVTYGRVEEAEEAILNNINEVKSTVDTLPYKVEEKLDPVQSDMSKLVENVQKQVDELRTIVENSPAGIMPPSMQYIKCASNDSGINVTYKPNLALLNNGTIRDYLYDSNIASRTKGVMVRYKTDTYPLDINDGVLAFIDEDVTEFVTDKLIGAGSLAKTYGVIQSKEKTHLVTGLTQNQYYYFTAFPYSTNNVYLEAPTREMNNSTGISCIRCKWTGTKGTLTVNVTKDYDYKPLGEYTATMTPTAGGQAITKTQSGAATIVFSGLEAGEYTLSFSDVTSFTKPQNQSVTVISGQSQIIDVEFNLSASLSSLTMVQIDELAQAGLAEKLFSIGDTTTIRANGEDVEIEIIDFNHDSLVSGEKAKITFATKNLLIEKRKIDSDNYNNKFYTDTEIYTWIENTLYNSLDSSLKNIIKTVKKDTYNETVVGGNLESIPLKLFLLSETEVTGYNQFSGYAEGTKYPIFTTDASRKKTCNGSSSGWWTRTSAVNGSAYVEIKRNGSYDTSAKPNANGICFGFCI